MPSALEVDTLPLDREGRPLSMDWGGGAWPLDMEGDPLPLDGEGGTLPLAGEIPWPSVLDWSAVICHWLWKVAHVQWIKQKLTRKHK